MSKYVPAPTLKERGFNMTEDDLRAREDQARGCVIRCSRELNHAKAALDHVALEMEDVAKLLRNDRRDIVEVPNGWLNLLALEPIWADIDNAQRALETAEIDAAKYC